MRARFLRLSARKAQELSALRREAERDGEYRVARRIHAVLLNHRRHTSSEIAGLLGAPRSKVSLWLGQYVSYGWEALLEGHRSGRPRELTSAQLSQLDGVIYSEGFNGATFRQTLDSLDACVEKIHTLVPGGRHDRHLPAGYVCRRLAETSGRSH